jgi:hypothetical protein
VRESSSILDRELSRCSFQRTASLRRSSAPPLLQETNAGPIDHGAWGWQLNLPELDIPKPKSPIRVVERLDPYRMPNEGFANDQLLTADGDHAVRRRGSSDHPPVRVLTPRDCSTTLPGQNRGSNSWRSKQKKGVPRSPRYTPARRSSFIRAARGLVLYGEGQKTLNQPFLDPLLI